MDLQVKYDPKELIPLEYESKIFNTIRESVVQMLDTLGCQRLAENMGEGLGWKEIMLLVLEFVEAVKKERKMIMQKEWEMKMEISEYRGAEG